MDTKTKPKSVGEIVLKAEQDYISGNTKLSKYVTFSLSENINTIEAYLASKHISGDKDSLNREKPFFNIVRSARNIWFRATDIDRKDIRIKSPTARKIILAFVATLLLKKWMRESNFGKFLNDWGLNLAGYGSSVVEFVEKDGKLIPSVLAWNRLIIDSVDFNNNPRIKILEMTQAQLEANGSYDQAQVKALINAHTTRKTSTNEDQDTKSDYIKVYEFHGIASKYLVSDKETDIDIYVQQMHTIAFVCKKDSKDEYDDFTLYKGQEDDPHMITHLIEEPSRSQSVGAVENLFEAQWMTNHSVKGMKDELDLAGKIIYQTADSNFASQNILTDIENGDILIHKDGPNMGLTTVSNQAQNIGSLQNYANMWRGIAQEITSTPDIMQGKTPPSGTAWRLQNIIQQESHSNFDIMRENKGLYVEEMLRRFIIPFLKKQMDTSEEISELLDSQDISLIDSAYVATEASRRLKQKAIASLVKGEVPQGLDMGTEQSQVQSELSLMGNTRYFKPSDIPDQTWKDLLKGFELEAVCDITGEEEDKDMVLTTLTTTLQSIAQNPTILQDPTMRMILGKILETTSVISAAELPPPRQTTPTATPNTQPTVTQPALPAGGGQ